MSSIDILASNPQRPADWRWKRAQEIYDGTGLNATRRRDGVDGFKWIRKAVRFIRDRNNCENDRDLILLSEKYPHLFWAYQYWDQATPQKHTIEARILARQTDYDIGYRVGVSPKTVAEYEALFFNVRDRMQHRSYIFNNIIGPAIHRGIAAQEYHLLWKLYGYVLGPQLVNALESKFSNPMWCHDASSVPAAILDDTIGTLKMKASVAAKTIEVNNFTQLQLLSEFTKYIEVERNSDDSGKSEAQVVEHVGAMMTALPFNVGGKDPRGQAILSPAIQDFERSAIELTYEETMRLAVNKPIHNAAVLKRLEFPVTQSTQLIEGPE